MVAHLGWQEYLGTDKFEVRDVFKWQAYETFKSRWEIRQGLL